MRATRDVVYKYIAIVDGVEKPMISLNRSMNFKATIERLKQQGAKQVWIKSNGVEYSHGYVRS